MRVRLALYERPDAWILGKFARRMLEHLLSSGIQADIGEGPDDSADINHHIIYLGYDGQPHGTDTLMITHVDSLQKVNLLTRQLATAGMGICVSQQTMEELVEAGIPRHRLCFVNPAHDGVMVPRPLVLGITSNTYTDGRKNERMLLDLPGRVSPADFAFRIMGSGWLPVVDKLRSAGFEVEHHETFEYDRYVSLVPTLDYYLYFSWDEGSMGFIDALAAGVGTIVTPQGFHLDAPGGITHPLRDDLVATLQSIAAERRRRVDAVASWTWENYTREHVDIWRYLLARRDPSQKASSTARGRGGLASVVDPSGDEAAPRPAAKLHYLLKPVTLKAFLWGLAPATLRRYYKERLRRRSAGAQRRDGNAG